MSIAALAACAQGVVASPQSPRSQGTPCLAAEASDAPAGWEGPLCSLPPKRLGGREACNLRHLFPSSLSAMTLLPLWEKLKPSEENLHSPPSPATTSAPSQAVTGETRPPQPLHQSPLRLVHSSTHPAILPSLQKLPFCPFCWVLPGLPSFLLS